jgi:hypothetical protein
MQTLTTIPARFNGPPASGNGGYSCGLLAAHIAGPARVRLHVPPPLQTKLRITHTDSGGVEMHDGDTLVGSAGPAPLELAIPAPPSQASAQAAMERFPCYRDHIFPTCFVCGPERPHRDGLALFPGPVADGTLWACVWRPATDLLDESGLIRPEILWSALDCPGYFAALGSTLRPAVLGELAGELRAAVGGDQPLVVYAWPLGEDGRKYFAGAAIATVGGEVVACSRSTWIALRT